MAGVISMQTRTLALYVVSDGFRSTVYSRMCVTSPHPAVFAVGTMNSYRISIEREAPCLTTLHFLKLRSKGGQLDQLRDPHFGRQFRQEPCMMASYFWSSNNQ